MYKIKENKQTNINQTKTKQTLFKKQTNKRPMDNIAHLSNGSHDKISFIESYTKYPDNAVE